MSASSSADASHLKLALEVLHAAVALDGVARMAKQLKVADGIESSLRARGDVVYGQDMEGQVVLASQALPLLSGIQQLFVRPRIGRAVKVPIVRAPGSRGANERSPVLPAVAIVIGQRYLQLSLCSVGEYLSGLRHDVDPYPLSPELLGGDTGGGAAAEWVEH